jgi:hypothetical protein
MGHPTSTSRSTPESLLAPPEHIVAIPLGHGWTPAHMMLLNRRSKPQQENEMTSTASLTVDKTTLTVRDAVFDLLRELGIRTMFGNPGSTELAFLTPWPADP